jgi:hypothetical protein
MHGNALLEVERLLSFSKMIYHQGTKDTKASADTLNLNLAFVINFNVERLNLGIYRIVMS